MPDSSPISAQSAPPRTSGQWVWLGVTVVIASAAYFIGLESGRRANPAAGPAPATPTLAAVVEPPTPTEDPSQPQFRDLPVKKPQPLAGLDDRILAALKEWKVAGCAVAVVHQDEVVYCKGFGVRKAGSHDPVDDQTLFGIASTTKGFTTMLAGMLVDEDRIAWDDPLSKHLPDVKFHPPLSADQVTLRDLLCHRTGLPRHDELWYQSGRTRAEVLEQLAHVRPKWDFRSRFGYQNLCYLAAGEALGRAGESDWDALITSRILTPLGMQRTFTTTTALTSGGANNASSGYDRGQPVPLKDLDNCAPATSLVSCATDMAKWLRFLLAEGRIKDQRLISRESLDAIFSPTMVMPASDLLVKMFPTGQGHAYALGWMTMEYREERVIFHPGNANGQRALVALMPDKDVGVVVLANSDLTPFIADVMFDVFDGYLGRLPPQRVADRRKLLHVVPDAREAVRTAFAASSKGQWQAARVAYDRALQIDPLYPQALHGRGAAWLELGQPARAIHDLSLALHLDPREAKVLSDRALARTRTRDMRGALADVNAALAIDPDLADAYNNRAIIQKAASDWAKVLADADKAIELNPKLAGAWALRGLAHLALGNEAASAEDFAECLKLAPSMKEAIDHEVAALRKP